MMSSDEPGAAVPPTVETVTTFPDGTTAKTSEYVRPDGSKSVVVERTDPNGNRSVETTEYPAPFPPPMPDMPQVPELSGKEVTTETRPDGSTVVTTVLLYADGSRDVIEEETRPDGSKMVTETRVPPGMDFGSDGGGDGPTAGGDVGIPATSMPPPGANVPGWAPYGASDPSRNALYYDSGAPAAAATGADPRISQPPYGAAPAAAAPNQDTYGAVAPPLSAQNYNETCGHQAHMQGMSQMTQAPTPHPEAEPEFAVEPPGTSWPPEQLRPSERPPDSDPDAKPSFWSRRRNQIAVGVLAFLLIIGVVLGVLFGTGTISTGSAAALDEPTPSTVAPAANMRAGYVVTWGGIVFEGSSCEQPTVGVLISCGPGGMAKLYEEADESKGACRELSSTGTIECSQVGTGAAAYSCLGSTRAALSTSAKIVPDDSLPCGPGGDAAHLVYLAVDCPGDAPLIWDSLKCDPSDAMLEDDEGGFFCAAAGQCQTGSACNLDIAEVTASVSESEISDDCLHDPSMPSTPTPTPSPVAPTATMRAGYVVTWGGGALEGSSCEQPTVGVLISCGPGRTAKLYEEANESKGACRELSSTGTIECSQVENGAAEYSCLGSARAALSTSAKIVPDDSLPCGPGGNAAHLIFLAVDCPGDAPLIWDSLKCDPSGAMLKDDEGAFFCFAVGQCQTGSACNLDIAEVTASVSESKIADDCLWDL